MTKEEWLQAKALDEATGVPIFSAILAYSDAVRLEEYVKLNAEDLYEHIPSSEDNLCARYVQLIQELENLYMRVTGHPMCSMSPEQLRLVATKEDVFLELERHGYKPNLRSIELIGIKLDVDPDDFVEITDGDDDLDPSYYH